MSIPTIPNGASVIVRHDMGRERGIVTGSTNGADMQRYTVRFADGTISSWGAHVVTLEVSS